MQWYCIDYWSEELGLDIAAIKRTQLARVGYLPGAELFLSKLQASGKRRVLVTNAHPVTLSMKNERVRLTEHFDACYSTHAFGAPKEDAAFWPPVVAYCVSPLEPMLTEMLPRVWPPTDTPVSVIEGEVGDVSLPLVPNLKVVPALTQPTLVPVAFGLVW